MKLKDACLLDSFWVHLFTAEDPLVSNWCNVKFLQICSKEYILPEGWIVLGGIISFRSCYLCIHCSSFYVAQCHKTCQDLQLSLSIVLWLLSMQLSLLAHKWVLLFSVCASVVFLNMKQESVMPCGGLELLSCLQENCLIFRLTPSPCTNSCLLWD